MTFAGFPKNAMQFWFDLSNEMTKQWFTDNKQRYQHEWVEPMTALLTDSAQRLAKSYKSLTLTPKVMRIHRDVRFSKDKSPYKTHIGGVITVGGKSLADNGIAAAYVHIGLDSEMKPEEFAGIGCYMFESKQLARWRKAVAGKPGAALAKQVATLRAHKYQVGGHDDLKKVPKPYDADHPRGELLKMKGLTAGFPPFPKGSLHQPKLADWLVEHATVTAPIVRWLVDHVA